MPVQRLSASESLALSDLLTFGKVASAVLACSGLLFVLVFLTTGFGQNLQALQEGYVTHKVGVRLKIGSWQHWKRSAIGTAAEIISNAAAILPANCAPCVSSFPAAPQS